MTQQPSKDPSKDVYGLNIQISLHNGDILSQIGPVAADNGQGISISEFTGLYSPARAIRLHGQNDGNYVLQYVQMAHLMYHGPDNNWSNQPLTPNGEGVIWITFWATNSAYNQVGDRERLNHRLTMQSDGNLVVYHGTWPVWASNTAGNPGAFLRLQDDGNLFITAQGGRVIWSSNTSVLASKGVNVQYP